MLRRLFRPKLPLQFKLIDIKLHLNVDLNVFSKVDNIRSFECHFQTRANFGNKSKGGKMQISNGKKRQPNSNNN